MPAFSIWGQRYYRVRLLGAYSLNERCKGLMHANQINRLCLMILSGLNRCTSRSAVLSTDARV